MSDEEITGHGAATITHRASGTEDPGPEDEPDDDTPPADPDTPAPTVDPDDDNPPSDEPDDDDEDAQAKPFRVLAAEYAGQVIARGDGPVKAVVEDADGTRRTIPGSELKED